MKKLLTMVLCLGAFLGVNAQKAVVDQASKMSGKEDKLEEARNLINEASKNPETSNDARTYYVGGKLEFDVYDKARTKQMINPQDQSVDPLKMAEQVLNGYEIIVKALPLDSLPNEKGQIKPKYSKDILSRINSHYNDYFNAGSVFYSNKRFYPEAYRSFMIYGDLPKSAMADKVTAATPDSVINTAYFNAGISAYGGNALKDAAAAFKKARLNGSENEQNYIYEIACWQYMAQNDSTMENTAKNEIEEIALDGYKKFGTNQMLFLNNLINAWIQEQRYDDALGLINNQIAEDGTNPAIYGLRGFVYDRMDKDDESLADYRKAASFENCDYETLKNAAKKIFRVGTQKWNAIEGNAPEARQDIKVNYFEAAKNIADKAKQLKSGDSDLDYVIENIDYALTTYFNN